MDWVEEPLHATTSMGMLGSAGDIAGYRRRGEHLLLPTVHELPRGGRVPRGAGRRHPCRRCPRVAPGRLPRCRTRAAGRAACRRHDAGAPAPRGHGRCPRRRPSSSSSHGHRTLSLSEASFGRATSSVRKGQEPPPRSTRRPVHDGRSQAWAELARGNDGLGGLYSEDECGTDLQAISEGVRSGPEKRASLCLCHSPRASRGRLHYSSHSDGPVAQQKANNEIVIGDISVRHRRISDCSTKADAGLCGQSRSEDDLRESAGQGDQCSESDG